MFQKEWNFIFLTSLEATEQSPPMSVGWIRYCNTCFSLPKIWRTNHTLLLFFSYPRLRLCLLLLPTYSRFFQQFDTQIMLWYAARTFIHGSSTTTFPYSPCCRQLGGKEFCQSLICLPEIGKSGFQGKTSKALLIKRCICAFMSYFGTGN